MEVLKLVDYLLFPELNFFNKAYCNRSVKQYLAGAHLANEAYEERQGGWKVIEKRITSQYGFEGFHHVDKIVTIKDVKTGRRKKITPQGYCCWNKELFVIVVCGTNDIADWLHTNLDSTAVPAPWGGKCGEGFLKYTEEFMPDFESYYQTYGIGKKIVFIGHSLGGAAAVIMAGIFYKRLEVLPHLVLTYGQPPCLFEDSAKILSKIIGQRTYRFVFSNDIVPRLPKLVFKHMNCKSRFISAHGCFKKIGAFKKLVYRIGGRIEGFFKLRLITKRTTTGIYHHMIEANYINSVEDRYDIDLA